jgi:hypothetical protein
MAGSPPTTPDFSTLWKNIFHVVEKIAYVFHAMEKHQPSFPHGGKLHPHNS